MMAGRRRGAPWASPHPAFPRALFVRPLQWRHLRGASPLGDFHSWNEAQSPVGLPRLCFLTRPAQPAPPPRNGRGAGRAGPCCCARLLIARACAPPPPPPPVAAMSEKRWCILNYCSRCIACAPLTPPPPRPRGKKRGQGGSQHGPMRMWRQNVSAGPSE
ncbi:MAG: hypothetical protein J3K34DRAFT_172053 [Monoraphidium minutum]|nr:MAG: hypothetical protein J3K34DRAFT_172053 [Monoraphidium minutum]